MNIENHNKEEWGGWKIVSDMLDNPYENGIYPTSECYQKLYEFVCSQKQRKVEEIRSEIENKMRNEYSFGRNKAIEEILELKSLTIKE